MAKSWNLNLSRRERQTMDVIYRLGEATAREIRANLPSHPAIPRSGTLEGPGRERTCEAPLPGPPVCLQA